LEKVTPKKIEKICEGHMGVFPLLLSFIKVLAYNVIG
jgi:hypothetical protein